MQIKSLYDRYINNHAEDVTKLKLLKEQLTQNDQCITSRKNFVGHITASAFIINPHTRQVLLLQHKTLGKLLQPGGHIENSDTSFTGAALREVKEETGLNPKDLILKPELHTSPDVPFHIDSHYIPENPRKNEPGHYHHDFRYLYVTTKTDVTIDSNESTGFQWIDWDAFAENPLFAPIINRIERLIEPNPRVF